MTKQQKQIWALVFFGLLSLAPVISIMTSLSSLRSAVLFDQEIEWNSEKLGEFKLPPLKVGVYEIRMESSDSKWDPILKLSWELKDKKSLNLNLSEPYEVALTRPLTKLHITEDTFGENDLLIRFYNSNPTQNVLRIKLAKDRDVILAQSTKQFAVILAVSLVLSLLFWRPIFRAR